MLVTPVTSESYDLAIWTAKVPMPPEAPLISTCCPAWISPWWRRPWSAVTAAIGTAAASSNDRFAGFNDMTLNWHRNVFRKAAGTVIQEVGIDLVAGLELSDAAAHRLHLPGNVTAEDSVLRSQQSESGARKEGLGAHGTPVRRIDRYCQHLHQNFIGGRRGLLDLRHPQRVRRTVLLAYERLHHWRSRSAGVGSV